MAEEKKPATSSDTWHRRDVHKQHIISAGYIFLYILLNEQSPWQQPPGLHTGCRSSRNKYYLNSSAAPRACKQLYSVYENTFDFYFWWWSLFWQINVMGWVLNSTPEEENSKFFFFTLQRRVMELIWDHCRESRVHTIRILDILFLIKLWLKDCL